MRFDASHSTFLAPLFLLTCAVAQHLEMPHRIVKRDDGTNRQPAEHRLYSYLLGSEGRYLRHVRPVINHLEKVSIRFGICLLSIDDILEKDQTMISTGCIKMKWTDENLRWDPADFDNLTWIVIPSSKIWIPDVAMINSPDPFAITKKESNVELSHTGHVGYYPTGRIITQCRVTLTYFPFDAQVCQYILESWAYPTQQVEFELWNATGPVDVKSYVSNHQWWLDGISVQPMVESYDGFNFSAIHFHFFFRRRPLYYAVYAIAPGLLKGVLQICALTLPLEHPARVTLLAALFIGSSVLQSYIASALPKSSEGVSLIQVYLMYHSWTLAFTIIQTALQMHIFYRTPDDDDPGFSALFKSYFLKFGVRPVKPPPPPPPQPSPIPMESIKEESSPLLNDKQSRGEQAESSEDSQVSTSSPMTESEERSPASGQRRLSTPNMMDVEKWPEVGRRWSAAAPPKVMSGQSVTTKMGGPMGAAAAIEEKAKKDKALEKEAARGRRRHKWLVLAAEIDRVCFYLYSVVHVVVPIFLFVVLPAFQSYPEGASRENVVMAPN